MGGETNSRVMIIKRKRIVVGGGHHGGAWKVAYADFVTAMMAFFMLMWLMNATTEQQRKGIADYFSPTIPITRISGGGDGSFGGETVFSETTAAQNGTGATSLRPTEGRQALGANGSSHVNDREDRALRELEAALLAEIDGSAGSLGFGRLQVEVRPSDEGLIIEIFEREGAPMFAAGTAQPAEWLLDLTVIISSLLNTVRNDVALTAHVSAEPPVRAVPGPWERSLAMVQSMRDLLTAAELDPSRIVRMTGYADRVAVTRDPMAMRNTRIEIVVLRSF